MKDLIATWLRAQYLPVESIQYGKVSWAVNELFELAHDAPDKLLPLVLEILKFDASEIVIGAIGSGVLEELLIHHGDEYFDKLAELCESNESLRNSARFIHLDMNDVSPTVFKKYLALKL